MLACSDSGGGEGGREPRWSAAAVSQAGGRAEVGADHVEVKWARAITVFHVGRGHKGGSGAGGEKCSSRRFHRRYIGLRWTSFRHCCDCHLLLLQVQLCHNRRAPRKSRTRGGGELNGRNERGKQRVGVVVVVGMAMVASFCECPNSLVHSRGKSSATLE